MADADDAAAPQQPQQQPQIKFQTLNQFVRDMSFENILARKPGASGGQPDIKVQVGLDARKRDTDNQYEASIQLKATSASKENNDEVFFILEVDYVGIFHIEGVPDEQMQAFLLIECPRQIFPFLRRIVSDVTRDGGFPPLNLENIDFVQLFRQEMQRRSASNPGAGNGQDPAQA